MIKILGSTYWPRLSWYVMSLSCGLLQQLLEFYMLQGFQCSDETPKSELKFKSFSPKITSHVVQNYHFPKQQEFLHISKSNVILEYQSFLSIPVLLYTYILGPFIH